MKKLSLNSILLAYHLSVFIIVLTCLYILKAGISFYWKWRLAKDGYVPICHAIDKLELTIEATQPVVWMAIGGAIMLVIVILVGYAFIDWASLAKQMDVTAKLKEELRKHT